MRVTKINFDKLKLHCTQNKQKYDYKTYERDIETFLKCKISEFREYKALCLASNNWIDRKISSSDSLRV